MGLVTLWGSTTHQWKTLEEAGVWYIYLHVVDFYVKLVGKYTILIDPMEHLGRINFYSLV